MLTEGAGPLAEQERQETTKAVRAGTLGGMDFTGSHCVCVPNPARSEPPTLAADQQQRLKSGRCDVNSNPVPYCVIPGTSLTSRCPCFHTGNEGVSMSLFELL